MEIFNDKNFIKELNEKLKNGGVISFVTDTVWGVGCLPDNEKGVEKMERLLERLDELDDVSNVYHNWEE